MSALIVEQLEARLARVLPGALLVRTLPLGPDKTWTVITASGQQASGPSQREAIQRAEMLFGSQR